MSDPDAGKRPAAVIVGCAGTALTAEERADFATADPLGLILFARNVDTPDQVRGLVASFREVVGRDDAPVMIDQEGGRVARLRPPNWDTRPPAQAFVDLAKRDMEAAKEAAWLNARLIAADLSPLGIDIDCAPVVDLPVPGAHDIIGDRAHGDTPDLAAFLGRAVCEGLAAGGVAPVVKHIPGHGRATSDSHVELPTVDTDPETLDRTDFEAFRLLADVPSAMVAHVAYSAIDGASPASTSEKIIREVIRDRIGFGGVLWSDDLRMEALSGSPEERAAATIQAGCDVVLDCGAEGNRPAIAEASGVLSDTAASRLADLRQYVATHANADFDEDAAVDRLSTLLADEG